MTNEEINELRNDLVLLSVAIDQMEKRMHEGFFNNAIAIARENMYVVNKYNPSNSWLMIKNWLMIKKRDFDILDNALHAYEISDSYNELVQNTNRMRIVLDTCFHKQGDIE